MVWLQDTENGSAKIGLLCVPDILITVSRQVRGPLMIRMEKCIR
jgi:hypothetical protein